MAAAAVVPILVVIGFTWDLHAKRDVNDWSWGLVALLMAILLVWVRQDAVSRHKENWFQALFESMGEGVVRCKVVYENGKPIDLIYLEVNRSFEKIMDLNDVVGKRVTELVPGIGQLHPELFEVLGRVASTGTPEQIDYYVDRKNRWVHMSVISMVRGEAIVVFEDITKRKLAYEQIHKLSCAVEQSRTSVVITDSEGVIEYVNPKFCEVTGYSPKDAIGKTPRILKSGEVSKEFYKNMWQTLKSGKEWRGEFHNRKKNGELFWDVTTISPICDTAGKVTHFLAVKEDITEHKRTQEELIWKTAFLEAQVDAGLDGVLVVDSWGKVILHNDRFLELTRIPKELLADRDDAKVLAWCGQRVDDPQGFARRIRYLYAHPDEIGRDEIVMHDGTVLDRYSAPVKSKAGKIYGRIWTFRDITERKQAQARIQEQAELLDKASDAIWMIDARGRISYWNKSAERLYGWTRDEAMGKTLLDLLFKGTMTARLQECLDTVEKDGGWTGELEEYTKDGATVIVEGRSNRITDESGAAKGLLVINTNITERKKLEAQLLRAQRMESIGTLAGGIAHDLNNILSPLMMSIQLMKDKLGEADDQQLLGMMEANVQRGANLVKQVLSFGRGVKGDRVPVQLKRVVNEVSQIIRESFPKSVKLEVRLQPALRDVTGDYTQLHQVLLNLCVNARDAMPGGGTLTITVANADVDQNGVEMGAQPGPFVMLQVADTGMGMSKNIQEHIFEPFFTTKEHGKGTGLGLSTTLGIVRSHGGFIKCHSEVGRGTIFSCYFPEAEDAIGADAVSKAAQPTLGRGELVLLVDDEESIRDTAERALTRFGYRVITACNGAEAVSAYKDSKEEIKAVITDLSMPVMDGEAAISRLLVLNPKVKIIASSGLGLREDASPEVRAAITRFIPKPYTMDTLLLVLHEVLDGAANN